MKASELISKLEDFIETHGDKPVEISPNGCNNETREFTPCTGYSQNGNVVCFTILLHPKRKKGGKR